MTRRIFAQVILGFLLPAGLSISQTGISADMAPKGQVQKTVIAPESYPKTPALLASLTIAEIREKAECGDSDAQFELGNRFRTGKDTVLNVNKAFEWYEKSAEQGNLYAQYRLGLCYSLAEGVSLDLVKAFEWYKKSAERGYSEAQYELGLCYGLAKGTSLNEKDYESWIKKSAIQGNVNALFLLGIFNDEKLKIPNKLDAFAWYTLAAFKNHEKAMKILHQNDDYREKQYAGRQRLKEICKEYQINYPHEYEVEEKVFADNTKKATTGDIDAQFQIGKAYHEGNVVKHNLDLFIKFTKLSAQNGHAEAQYIMSIYCSLEDKGRNGHYLPPESFYPEKLSWLKKSANQGYAWAQCELGEAYCDGHLTGGQKNIQEGMKLLNEASAKGIKSADQILSNFKRKAEAEERKEKFWSTEDGIIMSNIAYNIGSTPNEVQKVKERDQAFAVFLNAQIRKRKIVTKTGQRYNLDRDDIITLTNMKRIVDGYRRSGSLK